MAHYYYHLVDVAQILLNFGVRDQVTITAAILHDAIEDVDWITYDFVKLTFGKEVADTVLVVTKDPNIDYKQDRKALEIYVWKCAQNIRTALIKIADRIHNFGTLGDATPEKQLKQALETEEIFLPVIKFCRNAYPEHSDFFFGAKTHIEPHLFKIKESARIVAILTAQIDMLKTRLSQYESIQEIEKAIQEIGEKIQQEISEDFHKFFGYKKLEDEEMIGF